jgi:hypothetical protein
MIQIPNSKEFKVQSSRFKVKKKSLDFGFYGFTVREDPPQRCRGLRVWSIF